MIKKRIFSVILAVLLVITCASEAMFIKFLQNDQNTMEQEIELLQSRIDDQNELLQSINMKMESKADNTMIRLFLPDDIYVCETKGADIYNSAVVYGINLNSYAFHWEAPVGNSRNDRFEIPAMTAARDYEVTLRIYDLELNELATKTANLHIIPDLLAVENADASDEAAMDISGLNPLIYSSANDELPDFIMEYREETMANGADEEAANPGVIIVFPSVYEVYADLDATLGRAADVVSEIRAQYPETQILFVEPAYPGSNADEEAQLDEEGNRIPKWAYAEKTMIFKLVSALEKNYIEDDTVWVVPNALMTNSETSSDKVGDAIYGMLCRLVMENKITAADAAGESVSGNGQ